MTELVERTEALAVIDGVFASARGGEGACAVIEAQPGIGKTAVLAAVAKSAMGFLVLRARGGPLESDFSFGVVRQLLESVVARQGDPSLFGGPAGWRLLCSASLSTALPLSRRRIRSRRCTPSIG